MRDKICSLCNNEAFKVLVKEGVQYWQCFSCKTVFCDELDNSNMIGGCWEKERNEQNHIRVDRVGEMCQGVKMEEVRILDFGCGNFTLGNDLIKAGYRCDGYDLYNEKYRRLPEKNTYHIVIMMEVIEHMVAPFIELDVVYRCLQNQGGVYIETGFINIANEDGEALKDYVYISPEAGHSTIFSHHGLDLLMVNKGFMPVQHFNRSCRLFKKIPKP